MDSTRVYVRAAISGFRISIRSNYLTSRVDGQKKGPNFLVTMKMILPKRGKVPLSTEEAAVAFEGIPKRAPSYQLPTSLVDVGRAAKKTKSTQVGISH